MPDPTPAEIESGRDALRELGPAEALPADVLARLEARLEAEPGLGAPPRRRSRRRMPRLAFAAPGIAVALAATVAIVVLANRGQSEPAQDVSALSRLNSTTEASAPSATLAPKATAGDGASSKYAVARVRGPGAGRTQPARRASARPHPRAARAGRAGGAGVRLAVRAAGDEPDPDREDGGHARIRHPRRCPL